MIYIIIGIILFIIAFFTTLYIIYRIAFYSGNMKMPNMGDIFKSDKEKDLRKKIDENIEIFKAMPYEEVSINSFDNSKLYGRFYPSENSKNVMILFHGYKSRINTDGSRGVPICLDRGFNVLAVHQRGHDKSEGETIGFGILERLDCREWIKYITERIGCDCKILLMGLSMGATTVMMSSNLSFSQIKGIYADCGFSSPKEMLTIGIKKMKLPPTICYPLLRLSAKIFGHFDPESLTAPDTLKESKIPITIIHGSGDRFVPCKMAKECYDASRADRKKLVIVPDAGHGMCYYYDTERYELELNELLSIVESE